MASIRVTCSTNALAREPREFRAKVLTGVRARCEVRHNGGKVVCVTCPAGALDEVCAALDEAHQVTEYVVTDDPKVKP